MLDIKYILAHQAEYADMLKNRHHDFDLSILAGLDEKRRKIIGETEDLKAKRNEGSKRIGMAKNDPSLDVNALKAEIKAMGGKISELDTELAAGSTEDGFEYLSEVHTRWHTQWVQHEINRTTVLKERHILLTYHLRDDTLVTVTTGKLIADTDLTLLGNIDLSHLEHSAGQVIADADGKASALQLGIKLLVLADIVHDELLDHAVDVIIAGPAA